MSSKRNISVLSHPPKKSKDYEPSEESIEVPPQPTHEKKQTTLVLKEDNDIQVPKEPVSVKKYPVSKEKAELEEKKSINENSMTTEGSEESSGKDYISPSLKNTDEGLIRAIRKQDKILRVPYWKAKKNDRNNIFVMTLTEILTRVYLCKTFLLNKHTELLSCLFVAYILYQVLLLSLSAAFFDVSKISKIYLEKDFPNLGHYLLYGFISMVVGWAVYGLMTHIVKIEDKFNILKEMKKNGEPEDLIAKKMEKVKQIMRKRVAIFYCFDIVLMVFLFIYLTCVCGALTGTRKYIYLQYAITLVEICVIKFAYGLIMGILRFIAVNYGCKYLYMFVRVCDCYLT